MAVVAKHEGKAAASLLMLDTGSVRHDCGDVCVGSRRNAYHDFNRCSVSHFFVLLLLHRPASALKPGRWPLHPRLPRAMPLRAYNLSIPRLAVSRELVEALWTAPETGPIRSRLHCVQWHKCRINVISHNTYNKTECPNMSHLQCPNNDSQAQSKRLTLRGNFAPSSPATLGRGNIPRLISIFVSGPSLSSNA